MCAGREGGVYQSPTETNRDLTGITVESLLTDAPHGSMVDSCILTGSSECHDCTSVLLNPPQQHSSLDTNFGWELMSR